jgi:hypothetical protein
MSVSQAVSKCWSEPEFLESIPMIPTNFIHPISNEPNGECSLEPMSYDEASQIVSSEEFAYALRDVVVEAIGSVMPEFLTAEHVLNWSSCYEQDGGSWCESAALAGVVKAAQDSNRDPNEWHPAHQDALISLFFRDPHHWPVQKVASFVETRDIGVTVTNLIDHKGSSYWLCIINNCEMTLFRTFSIGEDKDGDDDAEGEGEEMAPIPRDEKGRFIAEARSRPWHP